MTVLRIENLSKSYRDELLFADLSLQLDEGDRLALTGPNGAGKTTLLRLIMGLESADAGSIHRPAKLIPGYLSQQVTENEDHSQVPLFDAQLKSLEDEMRRLEQEMQNLGSQNESQSKQLLADYSQVTARYEAAGGYEFKHRMQETTHGLGLPADCLTRPWSTLSGGERMRVALARLLIRRPDLLLLDEPTNHLDLAALEWLESYLSAFKGAILYVTHDRMFMNKTATAVAHLNSGSLWVRPGNYDRFLKLQAAEQETLARQLKQQEKDVKRQAEVTQTLLSHRNISGYHAREKVVARLTGELEDLRQRSRQLNRSQNIHFGFSRPNAAGRPDKTLLQAEDLSVAFSGKVLFRADRLSLASGEKVALCGPNGCGKSTLLNVFLGRQPAASGKVTVDSRAVFGYLGQYAHFADEKQSVLATLHAHSQLSETEARTLLSRYGFYDTQVHKQVSVLSGGERSRLYLCLLLLEQPDLLLLDEPTNHLDIDSREILEQALRDFEGAILAVSHDRYFINRCCERLYGFVQGQVSSFDTYSRYRATWHDQNSKPEKEKGKPSPKMAPQPQKNPAAARREQAQQKKLLQETEASILAMETEKEVLEQSFSEDSAPDDYEHYAHLSKQLEVLYQRFVTLSDRLDQGTKS